MINILDPNGDPTVVYFTYNIVTVVTVAHYYSPLLMAFA
jgi:hypothetical protein